MNQLALNRFKIMSGSTLKVLACVAMFIDHFAKIYLIKFDWARMTLFSIFGRNFSVVQLMVMFGRFAFPIFAFLLVNGFLHTKDRKRYGLNLFIFALLSEIPFNLMFNNALTFQKQNVMFTLLLGYLALCCLDYFKGKPLISVFSIVLLYVMMRLIKADYGASGYLFILLLYGLRKEKALQSLACSMLLQMKLMVFLSFIPINMYNGERGFIKTRFAKYCFYAFYPLHMLFIYLLAK